MIVSWIPGNGGTEIVFSSPTYTAAQPDVLGNIPANHITDRVPEQDGETVLASPLDARDPVTISFIANAASASALATLLRTISRAFSPASGAGTLKVVLDDAETFFLDCKIKRGSPQYPADKDSRSSTGPGLDNYWQRFTISLIAHSPAWYTAEQSQTFVAGTGWSYPIVYPRTYGTYSDTNNILNDGDLDCPFRLQIDGPMVNPTITNLTTGEYIEITKTLTSGQRLYIETTFGDITCEIRNATTNALIEDAFQYASIDSTWFWLISSDRALAMNEAQGYIGNEANRIKFESDDSNDGSSMILYWIPRHSAV